MNDSSTTFTVRHASDHLILSPSTDYGLPSMLLGYLDGRFSPRMRTGHQLTHPVAPFTKACIRANRSPNPLQVFRFLDYADVVLADVPFGLGWLLNIVVGKSSAYSFPLSVRSSRLSLLLCQVECLADMSRDTTRGTRNSMSQTRSKIEKCAS